MLNSFEIIKSNLGNDTYKITDAVSYTPELSINVMRNSTFLVF